MGKDNLQLLSISKPNDQRAIGTRTFRPSCHLVRNRTKIKVTRHKDQAKLRRRCLRRRDNQCSIHRISNMGSSRRVRVRVQVKVRVKGMRKGRRRSGSKLYDRSRARRLTISSEVVGCLVFDRHESKVEVVMEYVLFTDRADLSSFYHSE